MKSNLHTVSNTSSDKYSANLLLAVIFVSILFFSRSVLDGTLVPRFLILSVSLFLLLSLYIVQGKKITIDRSLGIFFGSYALLQFFSIGWALNSSEAVYESLKVFLQFCMIILLGDFLKKTKAAEIRILQLFSIVTAIALVIAAFQLFNFGISKYGNPYYIISICGHKNLFASFTFCMFFFNLNGMIKLKSLWKTSASFNTLGCGFFIVILQTRAVWLGFIGSIVLFIIFVLLKKRLFTSLNLKFNWSIIVAVAITILFSIFLFAKSKNKITQRADIASFAKSEAGAERLIIWEKTYRLILKNKLLGVGAGNWQIAYPSEGLDKLYNVELNNVTFQRPHNDFIWILAETGIVGLLIYLTFLGFIFFRAIQHILLNNAKDHLGLIIYLCCFSGYLIISFFDFPKERIEHLVVFSALVSLIVFHSSNKLNDTTIKENSISGRIIFLPILLIIFAIYFGYARWKGEKFTLSIYKYKQNQHWELVIKNCDKAYSQFYTLDPTTIPIHWYRGLADYNLGNFTAALSDFLIAKSYSPYNQHVLNNLASTYEMLGNHKLATIYYKLALKISPNFDDPKLNLAAIFYNAKDYEAALKWTNAVSATSERRDQYLNAIRLKISYIKKVEK